MNHLGGSGGLISRKLRLVILFWWIFRLKRIPLFQKTGDRSWICWIIFFSHGSSSVCLIYDQKSYLLSLRNNTRNMNLVALSNRYKEAISRSEEAIAEALHESSFAIFYSLLSMINSPQFVSARTTRKSGQANWSYRGYPIHIFF